MPAPSGEGSSDDVLPAATPQDLKLDPFANLEDGTFMIAKHLSVPSHFPQTTNNSHVSKWESFPVVTRKSTAFKGEVL